MRYAAIDPGGHTGWAIYHNDKPVQMGEILVSEDNFKVFFKWLEQENLHLDVLIVESYRNRPVEMTQGNANTWSSNLESQIVGACRAWCWINKKELVLQQPSIKPVGYGMAGLKYVPNKKGQHMQDALAHGFYWYMTQGRKSAES